MKNLVVFVVVLFISIPFSFAVEIQELFTIQSEESVEEVSSDGFGVVTYFYSGNKLLATKEMNGNLEYEYQDRLGSDINTKTLPFGQEISSDSIFSFTGKQLDESGLYYFGARYYDSDLGRFTSIDPVEDNHAYSYVNNNPMNYVDPSGMVIEWGSGVVSALNDQGVSVSDLVRNSPVLTALQDSELKYTFRFATLGHGEFQGEVEAMAKRRAMGEAFVRTRTALLRRSVNDEVSFEDYGVQSILHEAIHLYDLVESNKYVKEKHLQGDYVDPSQYWEPMNFMVNHMGLVLPLVVLELDNLERNGVITPEQFQTAWGYNRETTLMMLDAMLNYHDLENRDVLDVYAFFADSTSSFEEEIALLFPGEENRADTRVYYERVKSDLINKGIGWERWWKFFGNGNDIIEPSQ